MKGGNNMKKYLSLMLAISICFASLASAAADTYEGELPICAETAFKLGLIENDDNDERNPSGFVTRADFAHMVYRVLNYGEDSAQAVRVSYFSDVGIYHYAAAEIGFIAGLGIVNGYGDGTFRPEENIKTSDAAAILMAAAGYTKSSGISGDEINNIARSSGLFSGVSFSEDGLLRRAQAACLLGNFLFVNTVSYSDNKIETDGDTVLSRFMHLTYTDGVVRQSGGISLYDNEPGDNILTIDNEDYFLNNPDDYESYVGMRVRCYADEDNVVASLIPMKNKILTLSYGDIISYKDNVYTYYDENGSKKQARLAPDRDMLLNNAYYSGSDMDLPTYTKITLIDNDNSGVYDIVKIDEYMTGIVDKVRSSSNAVVMKNCDENGNNIVYDFDSYKNIIVYDEYGAKNEFGRIKSGMVISVAKRSSDTVIIYTSSKRTEGKVTEFDRENMYVKIDGVEYPTVYNPYMSRWDGAVGTTLTVYFDYLGNAAAFEGAVREGWSYAYIIRCTIDDTTDLLTIKLLDRDGKIYRLACDDSVYIDSKCYKNASDALLKMKQAYSDFAEYSKGETESEKKVYDRMSVRLMRYYISGEKIKRIDTPVFKSMFDKKTENNDFSDCLEITAKGNLQYSNTFSSMLRAPYTTSTEISGEIVCDAKTAVFVVPSTNDDLSDNDLFGVYSSLSDAKLKNDTYYASCGYTISDGNVISDAVVISKSKGESSSTFDIGIYYDTYDGIDDEEEVSHYVRGIFDGSEQAYPLSDNNKIKLSDLKRGDAILYSVENGKIAVELIAYRDEPKSGTLFDDPIYLTRSGEKHYFAKGRICLAKIIRIQDGNALIKFDNDKYQSEIMTGFGNSILMCDLSESKNMFTTVSADEIKTVEVYGENADYIIFNQRDGYISDKLLIRK